ncbi:MAG TPA: DUF4012 domain-containing protein [Mycobacteriales bacterium]|nr:DUF4012 domain-containing protein [Mycobacteriales bacterium]
MLRWLAVLCGVVLLYFLATGRVARHHLEQAKSDVDQVRHALLASDHDAAHRWMTKAQSQAHDAHDWLAGPAWAGVGQVPWLGRPAKVERGLAGVAVTLADRALPAAVQAGDDLTPSQLRLPDGAVRLAAFASAVDPLDVAAAATAQAQRQVAALPHSTWLPPANHARTGASSLIGQLHRILRDAHDAAALAPGMLGGQGTRRYLLVVENDAEARGLGGLPGVTAVLTVSNGRLSFGRFENNSFLNLPPSPPVPVGAAYRNTYADTDALTDFVDSDLSPDFPTVGKVWVAMWKAKTGEQLDGAIAADPTTLSYLLSATGPAYLADGTKVSGKNIVALTEQEAYSRFDSLAARQAFFIRVARAAANQLVNAPHGSAHALVEAMSHAVTEHRLMVWSARAEEQSTLDATPLAGGLPDTESPFVAVTVNNSQGSKLDYYLEKSVTYDRTACSVSGEQLSTVTVRLHNGAPANLPAYVTTRLGGTGRFPVGSERSLVALYTTHGANLLGVTADGTSIAASIGEEVGHPRYDVEIDTAAGATTTLVFHVIEPRHDDPVTVWRQPGINPEVVRLVGSACG